MTCGQLVQSGNSFVAHVHAPLVHFHAVEHAVVGQGEHAPVLAVTLGYHQSATEKREVQVVCQGNRTDVRLAVAQVGVFFGEFRWLGDFNLVHWLFLYLEGLMFIRTQLQNMVFIRSLLKLVYETFEREAIFANSVTP